MVSPPGVYGERLRDEGFRWLPVPLVRRSLNPWAEAKLLWTLIGIYRKECPTLVHHFTIKSVVYGCIAAHFARTEARINAVTGLGHVFINENIRTAMLRPVVRILLRLALCGRRGRLILQNRDDQALFLKNRLVKSTRIRIIRGSGVDSKRFSPSIKAISDGACRPFRVLLATRLLWEKGVGEYIEAARLLRGEGKIQFLLAGSPDPGNPASVPTEKLMEWMESGLVNWLGHSDDISQLLNKVDLIVLPSYREGTPRILLEGASCGLPIVTTDVPGCREVVENGVNGLLVPAKDSGALAKAIKYIFDHSAERERMGTAGRNKILAEFEQALVIESTLAVYREVALLPVTEKGRFVVEGTGGGHPQGERKS